MEVRYEMERKTKIKGTDSGDTAGLYPFGGGFPVRSIAEPFVMIMRS